MVAVMASTSACLMSGVKVAMVRSGTEKGMLTTGMDAAVTAGAALGGRGCIAT